MYLKVRSLYENREKELSCFGKHKASPSGISSTCKQCNRRESLAYKRTPKSVFGICLKTGNKQEYHSISQAARANSVADSNICAVLKGKKLTSANKTWSYITL
jgi:hypothetical protein